ncbi:2-hydroxyhepta-2,4-diene-1,7-dioate isomerase [Streptomyces spongiicola]|uniref:2-hydroxyhepta-2,4-diene-1,7-dioate isomerase n=1 Tax=Streptomyces spongiicola TaxID=1690221 RepID=A0ABM6V6T4_9ACTN|nr:fumarylacetoacetate hydrolase family protein [Streptomyces spongiicola]AWK09587.1 2-hydroxyhepta-2,4-diene-1,7-dioate isomerase [Streptomyces spongiicola]
MRLTDESQRLARFEWQGEVLHGRLITTDGDDVLEVLAADPLRSAAEPTGRRLPLDDVRLLAPVTPGKIVAVGRNYADHIAELSLDTPTAPRLFFKPPSAVVGPGEAIRYPAQSREVHYEAELAVVIGRTARGITAEQALEYVFGYTCANDVTARDIQREDGQPSWAKAFDTFCPLGPWITTNLDPTKLDVRCEVNGTERQSAGTDTMLHPVASLLAYITAAVTLEPGDVLLTGTPAGVGPVVPGDEVAVYISGIGSLVNPVAGR